ncbi:hypothetical protein WR25_19494 [Diploscapter pachys]|uniref:Zinc transporter ZIP14 n=1 Tax=Diploscapter pachys TaxID=2018661 RepID=A0A2A2K098_9BILA|nr:hypothetical protein WR25_19494 [Diploscapter pachys]
MSMASNVSSVLSALNMTAPQLETLCSGITASGSGIGQENTTIPEISAKSDPVMAWTIGLSVVTVINLCSVVGIVFMRYLSKDVYNKMITMFVGLGVGSLSGSSFYHLLPNAYPSLAENHDYFMTAHYSILGVYMFFFCDKAIKIIMEAKKKHRSEGGAARVTDRSDAPLIHVAANGHTNDNTQNHKDQKLSEAEIESMMLESITNKSMGDQAHGICVHDHSLPIGSGDSNSKAIAAVAWMIIFGDGLHNLIDGISIGAAFSESIRDGISICLAVLCEEFPHELGDVAILVASGLSLKQAFFYNLLSAITCYIGFVIGILIGELGDEVAKYAFALAGGMFLYISLGCMMPEMKKAMEDALGVSMKHGLKVLFLQTTGIFCGLTLMYVMSRHGESIQI